MTAFWRRTRQGHHTLSPALDAFVDCLGVTPYEWYLSRDGKLRTNENGADMCALTAVARYRLGRTYSVGDWIHAGESIGLSFSDAALVVDAADARQASAPATELRRRLLSATVDSQRHTPVAPAATSSTDQPTYRHSGRVVPTARDATEPAPSL